MRYSFLGSTGLKVSELCLGATEFGDGTPADEARRIWARCLDAGVNFVDTADFSPESERLLGEWIGDRRGQLVISTKVFRRTGPGPNQLGLSRKHIVQSCEASLRRLKTEYIDLYFAHSDDFLTPLEETLGAFDQLVRQGKVLYLGASNYTAWRLNEALWTAQGNGWARYCCVQALYNLHQRDIEAELLPMCAHKGLGAIAWSPLARGALTDAKAGREAAPAAVDAALAQVAEQLGRPRAQVALRWALNRAGMNAVAIGPSSLAQAEQNLGACDLELDAGQMAALDAAGAPRRPYPANLEPLARALRNDD